MKAAVVLALLILTNILVFQTATISDIVSHSCFVSIECLSSNNLQVILNLTVRCTSCMQVSSMLGINNGSYSAMSRKSLVQIMEEAYFRVLS